MSTFKENLKTTFARFKAKYLGYTTCSTAAATAAKTATLTNFALATGSQVKVKFTYANTASAPTLNVNSTGAKSIKAYGTTAPTVWWSAGDVVSFTYDGTNWIMEASNGQVHSLNSSFSSALTALKNTAIAQAVGATGSTFTAVIDTLSGIVNRGAVSQTLNTSTTSYTIPAGYHNGSGKVSITTETKTQAPGTSAVDVTPSSGKVLSKVTVSAISTQEKTVTSSRSAQTVTPDSGKYLTKVTVNKYADASGTYGTITTNGTHDMGATNNYRYVGVSVAPTAGSEYAAVAGAFGSGGFCAINNATAWYISTYGSISNSSFSCGYNSTYGVYIQANVAGTYLVNNTIVNAQAGTVLTNKTSGYYSLTAIRVS